MNNHGLGEIMNQMNHRDFTNKRGHGPKGDDEMLDKNSTPKGGDVIWLQNC